MMKTRTVNWCEGKILRVLAKKPIIKTYLALSAQVLENVRSTDEQVHLDIAVENLLSRRMISRYQSDGMTVFSLKAA